MSFDEASSVRDRVRDELTQIAGGWRFVPAAALDRSGFGWLDEEFRDALIRLNPDIAANPGHIDRIQYEIGAIILSSGRQGLVKANQDLRPWLLGEKTLPIGENGRHVAIRLLDFVTPENNSFILSTEVTFQHRTKRRRFDVVGWVNGMPLVVGEAKSPTRPSVSWLDAAYQVASYEEEVTPFFVPNVFSFAIDGREVRYAAIGTDFADWTPWPAPTPGGVEIERAAAAVRHLVDPETVLDMLAYFTVYGSDDDHQMTKIVPRHQQFDAANRIVSRVLAGSPRKGLIWHFQGSGKSLLMVFTAGKLRRHPRLGNPTVLIVVDRIELDTQISSTFNAADVPGVKSTNSGPELIDWLRSGQRMTIITTIQKFRDARVVLSDRDDIICLVDEAHRTQEGDLGTRMRDALPNAFLFGMTGTPINQRDRNTFKTFGADDDPQRYLSRYSQADSLTDGTTVELRFQPRLTSFHLPGELLDKEFAALTEGLTETQRHKLVTRTARMEEVIKQPDRLDLVCVDVAEHFTEHVAPKGFKAMVVTFDKEACWLYKQRLDLLLGEEASDIVISDGDFTQRARDLDLKRFVRTRTEEEKLLDRFRDPKDPLQILIVTAKLLTGFDAPIMQTMYLDKVMKDHTLLQAICRVNRPYSRGDQRKTHGVVIDYVGVFSDLKRALQFDEQSMQLAVQRLSDLASELPEALAGCLAFFPGLDRTDGSGDGLEAAQRALVHPEVRDQFAAAYVRLSRIWEAISPDPQLAPHRADYLWLSQVYESVRPRDDEGRILWRKFGAQTRALVASHLKFEAVHADLDTLVLDADMARQLEENPAQNARKVHDDLKQRLLGRRGDPSYAPLSEKLEQLRNAYEANQLTSILYLKRLLHIARELVARERATGTASTESVSLERNTESGREALTRLFEQAGRDAEAPADVQQVVEEIDRIVMGMRWEGWQRTTRGEREVKRALRKVLYAHRMHHDEELFARAYAYIAEHY
ncbi:HsdR family type I site-specific deoxyribonuclease [Nonomuraea roseoviolacea subsp. roseoviolacea]|uniref:type I restriction endonuclease subunit R n=1 Tax=Nonomuraea roseoviolacea TaxID=103837 RepID=UPI0031DB6312